ncbi:MAG: serine/threonine protein kinase [Pseudomonadota bacterium]
MAPLQIFKRDLFGQVELHKDPAGQRFIRRSLDGVRWWVRPVARWLAGREARALAALNGLGGTPRMLGWNGRHLDRSWIEGQPMQQARPTSAAYFASAAALLRQMHRAGVAHNDLAKEPNWLVTPAGGAAVIDFQLAACLPGRGALFRTLAREDLRHLLKHKRTYRRDFLTARERRMLATPAWPSRVWMATVKPVYTFVTRRLMGWADREGAGDRRF